MAKNPTEETRREDRALTRRQPSTTLWSGSPFSSIFQRWNDEMDRFFDDFGFGRRSPTMAVEGARLWSPQIEVFQKGNDLIVRADLPGLSRDEVHVDINDNVLTIQGERKQEHEEERDGWYRNERSFGSFHRAIPLPEGTIADSAKATFKDGVLEVVLQAPPREVSRGRRVEISDK
jgi:HSP20 family protein